MVTIAQAVHQVKDDLPALIAPIFSQALAAHPAFILIVHPARPGWVEPRLVKCRPPRAMGH